MYLIYICALSNDEPASGAAADMGGGRPDPVHDATDEADDLGLTNWTETEQSEKDEDLIYVSNDNPRVSTRGRVMRPSWRFKDYVMDVDDLHF